MSVSMKPPCFLLAAHTHLVEDIDQYQVHWLCSGLKPSGIAALVMGMTLNTVLATSLHAGQFGWLSLCLVLTRVDQ